MNAAAPRDPAPHDALAAAEAAPDLHNFRLTLALSSRVGTARAAIRCALADFDCDDPIVREVTRQMLRRALAQCEEEMP